MSKSRIKRRELNAVPKYIFLDTANFSYFIDINQS